MIRTIGAKLLGSLGVLLALSAIVFFAGRELAPGNIATVLIGSNGATRAQTVELMRQLGLNQPLYIQYFDWLRGVAVGNLGISPISHLRVSSILAQETPVSLELAFLSLIVSTVVGVPLGIVAATHANRFLDWLVRVPTMITFAVPVFVAGTLALLIAAKFAPFLYAAAYTSPSQGLKGNFTSMFLPALSAGLPTSALLVQMTRSSMLESLSSPSLFMARAKGVSRRRIVWVHALKLSLGPILTLEGFNFGILLGSLFVVEDIFSLPGLGRGVLAAINDRDFVVLEAQVMVIAVVFMIGNIVAEVLNVIVDRRLEGV